MRSLLTPDSSDPIALTAQEQARLSALLGSVSTHTLLHSLTGLERDSEDARLLIAALMQRLPSPDADVLADSGARHPDVADHRVRPDIPDAQ